MQKNKNISQSKKLLFMLRTFVIVTISLIVLISCEDPAPTDYIPQNFIEAVLIVDEPIRSIKIMKTQPLADSFNYEKSFVRDALVKISEGSNEYILDIEPKGTDGYYFNDTSVKVKSNTEYKLEVVLSDGTKISGNTITPRRTKWISKPEDFIYYPKDTVKLTSPDTINFSWETVQDVNFYIIAMQCLDTIEYGKYLIPQSDELNRRVFNPFRGDNFYKETSAWSFVPTNKIPVFWSAFKWFGVHEFRVYVSDWNFLRWMIQWIAKSQYDPLLSSFDNAIGVFGSASVIRDTSFLIKNQP